MRLKSLLVRGDLTFFAALAVVGILPLYGYYLPPFMILWGILWLFENKFRFTKEMFRANKASVLFLLFILFYLWQISGLLLADSLDSGLERIVKRLSFLLFPLVLFSPCKKIILNINLILRIFAICTLIYIVYCFGNAIHNSLTIQSGNWTFNPHPVEFDYENYFYGYHLADTIHPTYLSMYVLLSVLISLESFFDTSLKLVKRGTWLAMTIIFLIVLYLLSSRAGILAAIIVVPLYFLIKFYNRFSKWIILSSVIILVALLMVISKTNTRVNYYIEGISNSNIKERWENDIRYSIWKSAFGVIKENMIFGVGTGDASNALKKEFLTRGYVDGYYDNLNAHNQYLETLLENGIIGLFIFLSILGYMIYYAFSEKNLLYGMFILMIMIFFFFETILNRLSGITFFALFSFLLIYYKSPGRS